MSKRDIAIELHRPVRKNYTRRTVNVYGKNDLWQADLVEMISLSKKNNEYKYILCVIDCFTEFTWAIPLKTKTACEVTGAMSKILIVRSPKLLQVDNGKEFYNLKFDMLMTKHNNYNNSKHRTIGMTTVQVEENPALVTLKHRTIVNIKVKFHVGNKVRISTQKGVFTKGFSPNWSTEIFTIVKINKTEPPTYQLHDYHDEPIASCFYTEEISKTNFPNDYLIEKIIRKKGNKIYVKWIVFDNYHNSWINKNEIKNNFSRCSEVNGFDIHCILGVNNTYFIKEMSIADTETWTHQHFIFKHTFLKQDAKSRSVNSKGLKRRLERLQHCLSLEYGDIEYGEIQKIFQSLKFCRIYFKGLQKQQIIEEFMPHVTIFKIENLECPRLFQLNGETLYHTCIITSHLPFRKTSELTNSTIPGFVGSTR
ncbi:Integrase catalytic domain-containing protein, partial [Aphis craccivora]